jgi:4a-hydroxytetrahydrobiopterin dehydratase
MNWTEEQLDGGRSRMSRSFIFKNFSEAWAFMNRVALMAEKANHHPDWTNVYNRVEIHLNTHSAGGVITEKDRKLATEIDTLLTSHA